MWLWINNEYEAFRYVLLICVVCWKNEKTESYNENYPRARRCHSLSHFPIAIFSKYKMRRFSFSSPTTHNNNDNNVLIQTDRPLIWNEMFIRYVKAFNDDKNENYSQNSRFWSKISFIFSLPPRAKADFQKNPTVRGFAINPFFSGDNPSIFLSSHITTTRINTRM